jgi:hypothetical protein
MAHAVLASALGIVRPQITGAQETQHAPGMFVQKFEVGRFRGEPRRLALERGTGSLETLQVLAQRDTARQKPGSRLEAIPMLQRLIDECAQKTQAEKQHQRLPGLERSSIMGKLTTGHVNHLS